MVSSILNNEFDKESNVKLSRFPVSCLMTFTRSCGTFREADIFCLCTLVHFFFWCSYHIASKTKTFSSTPLGVALPYLDIIYPIVISFSSTYRTGKCPPWCHCRLPEGEYSEISNVWVHARREAPFWAGNKAPEAVAKGPGAQSEGARGTTEASGPCRQVLGFISGAQEPVETLREY